MVLILVLMDDALVQVEKEAAERGDEVLILVLMDDALVPKKNRVERSKSLKS